MIKLSYMLQRADSLLDASLWVKILKLAFQPLFLIVLDNYQHCYLMESYFINYFTFFFSYS